MNGNAAALNTQVADEFATAAAVGHAFLRRAGKETAVRLGSESIRRAGEQARQGKALNSEQASLVPHLFYSFSPRAVKAVVAMICTVSLRMLKSWATKKRRSSGSSWEP